jgi:hypothetical protein
MNIWLTIAIIIVILWLVGFFAFPGGRLPDKFAARGCRNLCSCLAVNWQKAVEINQPFFCFSSN